MAKKDTAGLNSQAPVGAVTEAAQEPSTDNTAVDTQKNKTEAGRDTSGFFMYIGPTIKGLIRTGDIYRGDRAHALAEAQKAIEQQPLVKTLIVSGDALPAARMKVKTPGNALYANYRKVLGR